MKQMLFKALNIQQQTREQKEKEEMHQLVIIEYLLVAWNISVNKIDNNACSHGTYIKQQEERDNKQ